MRRTRIGFGLILGIQAGLAFAAQWTPASDGLTGSIPAANALVIDRSTGSTLYALTSAKSNLNVFKSTDGGANWTALGNITGVNVLALDPVIASALYAGTAGGIFKSTDGGESWISVGLSGMSIVALAIDPITPSTLYAGADGHLYKSADRGGSWTDLNLGAPAGAEGFWIAGLVLDPFTPSTLYVALGWQDACAGAALPCAVSPGGNILKSVDGGATWNVIYANAGPFFNTLCTLSYCPAASSLVIDPSNPSTLYRINPMKKSTDGGVTWSPTGFTNNISALAVDPNNSNTLYVSSADNAVHAIYKSTDGGQSWNTVDTIIPATGSFVFSPASSTIYAATAGGVFKSTDAGLSWGEAKTGLNVFEVEVLVGDPVNAGTIYAGDSNGLFKSTDSGENWTKQAALLLPAVGPVGAPVGAGPAEIHSLLIDFSNPNIQYMGTARPGFSYFSGDILLYKSTDGGSNWSAEQGLRGCGGPAMAMDPVDPNTLYASCGNDYDGFNILQTTDGGANWKNINPFNLAQVSSVNAIVIDRNTPTTLYAATDLGVLRSTDGGANFLPIGLANTPVAFLAIDPVRPNVFYAATSNNPYPYDNNPPGLVGLYKSADSGASWSAINNGLDEIIAAHPTVTALLVDAGRPNILYLATSGFGVFKSADGGTSWAAFNDGLMFLDVRSLAVVRGASSTVYAGTPGGVFKIVNNRTPSTPIRRRAYGAGE